MMLGSGPASCGDKRITKETKRCSFRKSLEGFVTVIRNPPPRALDGSTRLAVLPELVVSGPLRGRLLLGLGLQTRGLDAFCGDAALAMVLRENRK